MAQQKIRQLWESSTATGINENEKLRYVKTLLGWFYA